MALPELPPYPGQADAALHLVHVRRRRAAAVAASAAGAVVVASLLVSARGTGVATVDPARPVVTTAAPDVRRTPAPPPARAARPGVVTVTASAPAPVASPAPRRTTAAPSPTRPATPGSAAPAGPRRDPVLREHFTDAVTCAGIGPWCAAAEIVGPASAKRLRIYACHPAWQEEAALTFDTVQEVDFVIAREGSNVEEWVWSADRTFAPDRHVLTAPGGTCFAWSTPWNGLHDDGTPLQPGSYELRGVVSSAEAVGVVPYAFEVG